METERMIIKIKRVALNYSNRKINTFDTDITKMCNAVIPKLELLKMYENTELTPKEIECSKNNKWIPVSEMLPKADDYNLAERRDSKLYLVQDKCGAIIICEYLQDNSHKSPEFFYAGRPYVKLDVIAWQPLPEPYKGATE